MAEQTEYLYANSDLDQADKKAISIIKSFIQRSQIKF